MFPQTKPTKEEIALFKCFGLEPRIISDSELVELIVLLVKYGNSCIDELYIKSKSSLKKETLSSLFVDYNWFASHLEYGTCEKTKRNIENNIKRIFRGNNGKSSRDIQKTK